MVTAAEYERMIRAGVFDEDERVELLDGDIVWTGPKELPHLTTTRRLNRWASRSLSDRIVVSVQDPVNLNDRSQPEPDLLLLHPRVETANRKPEASDVFLAIEVADSSLRTDHRKVRRYAAGIPNHVSSIAGASRLRSTATLARTAIARSRPSAGASRSRRSPSPTRCCAGRRSSAERGNATSAAWPDSAGAPPPSHITRSEPVGMGPRLYWPYRLVDDQDAGAARLGRRRGRHDHHRRP